jgi:hypothetical protein
MAAVLVLSTKVPVRHDRDAIDERAKQLVLDAYREACHTRSQTPFDAALNSYLTRYPHISRELAGHAVAHILAAAEI